MRPRTRTQTTTTRRCSLIPCQAEVTLRVRRIDSPYVEEHHMCSEHVGPFVAETNAGYTVKPVDAAWN